MKNKNLVSIVECIQILLKLNMNAIIAILVSSVIASVCSYSRASKHKKIEKPNILLIYSDDVGYGDLSCYGAKLMKTPNIDSIASNGVRFTNAYASSAM